MTSRLTPEPSKSFRRVVHDGSMLVELKPFSGSKPMCATCTKEPAVGPEIIDLSILPPLADFFFSEEEDLTEVEVKGGQLELLNYRTFICFTGGHFLVEGFCIFLISKDKANHAFLGYE